MHTIQQLHRAGQSIWYDNIQRGLLVNGELAGMIERGEIRGVTSNPTIFMNAITKSHDYDAGLVPLARAGNSAQEIFWHLAIEDIRTAARPLPAHLRRDGWRRWLCQSGGELTGRDDAAATLVEASSSGNASTGPTCWSRSRDPGRPVGDRRRNCGWDQCQRHPDLVGPLPGCDGRVSEGSGAACGAGLAIDHIASVASSSCRAWTPRWMRS